MLPSAIALPALKAVVMEWSLLQLLLALATLPLLLCLSCYIYMMWPVWIVRHIPCPPYRLGLGHLPLLIAEESECFMRLAKEYGPVYRFHFTRQPIVMVADAELCRQLSIKNFKMARDRAKPASILTVPFMHRGLFFSRGQTWSSMRNIELPFYHSDRMRKYVSVMCAVADTLVKRLSTIEAGEDVNISDFLPMLTLDVIGETAFGAHFQTLQSSKATQSGNKNADPKKNRTAELDRKLQVAVYEWQNNMRLDGAGSLRVRLHRESKGASLESFPTPAFYESNRLHHVNMFVNEPPPYFKGHVNASASKRLQAPPSASRRLQWFHLM